MYFSLIDCSQKTVVYVEGILFVLNLTSMLSDVNRIKLVSEISTVFPFSNRKAKIIKFDLAVK